MNSTNPISRIVRLCRHLRPKTAVQFLKFSVIGAANTTTDLAIYLIVTRVGPLQGRYVLGAIVSFAFAVLLSYAANSAWTFKGAGVDWHRAAPKFAFVAVIGLAIHTLTLASLISLGLHDILAKMLATGVSLAWNFPMQKRWTFRM